MRTPHQNTTNFKKGTNTQKLVLVRTSVLYGLSFETVKQEKITYNSGITSIPTVVYFNNNTECFFDFSNQTNQDVEVKTKVFFSKVTPGTTFYVLNGFYYDSSKNQRADITGEYVFQEYFNGLIKATVTTVDTLIDNQTRYDKKYFEEIPLISVNSLSTTEINNVTIIRNVFGSNTKNSFNYMGLSVGDFISLSEVEGKYEVIEIFTDPNGIETVKIKGTLTPKSLTNTKILVSLYIPYAESYTTEANANETQLGSCVQTQNGVVISCRDNHTASQCRFRSSELNQIDSTIYFGNFCTTPETDTSVEISTTDKLVQITNLLASSIALSTNNANNINGPVNNGGNTKTSFYGRI